MLTYMLISNEANHPTDPFASHKPVDWHNREIGSTYGLLSPLGILVDCNG
jgi:hypothetical protein